MKNLQGLLSVVEAAAAGSFTAAAARLDLTPAAVSKNVAGFEKALGVRLFQRGSRRLAITAEGQAFLDRAVPALAALQEAVGASTQASAAISGRVRLSASVAFGRRWVMPLLPRLLQAHPALEIELGLDNRQVDLIADGFDIGIRGARLADSSLVARPVCKLPVVLVASPDYLRRHGVPRDPAVLAQHQLIGIRLASGATAHWLFDGDTVGAPPAARLWCSDPEAPVDLALAGAGICQTGLQHVTEHLRAGTLKIVLRGRHEPGEREVVLHYPHRRFLSPRVRVVVDALLEHLRAQEDLQWQPSTVPRGWCAG
jgi:DNA-binding transcriptional LysR family regulator